MTVSAIRTIVVSPPPSAYGVLMAAPTLRWPVAQPDDDLDYSLDIGDLLSDAADSLSLVSISISPWGAGELVAASLDATGSLITAWLSGGIPGRDYTAKIAAQTIAGRAFEYLPHLLISPDLASNPVPAPVNPGFGTAITWNLARPLILSLAAPLSLSNTAALF